MNRFFVLAILLALEVPCAADSRPSSSPLAPTSALPARAVGLPGPGGGREGGETKARAHAAKTAPKATSLPGAPADVKLTLETPTTRGPWTVRVINRGDVPVDLVADLRFLSLDVTPRSGAHPLRCELPSDMRPSDPLDGLLVLPPKQMFVETFEPRLYCLAGRPFDALVASSIVVAKLGWDGPGDRDLMAVSPLDGVRPIVSARRVLRSDPVALPDEVTATLNRVTEQTDPPRLSLKGPEAVDAESADRIELPLTLSNEGSRPAIVRFRPEMLSFEVTRVGTWEPVQKCSWPTLPGAATREEFETLGKSASLSLTLELQAYCGGHVLDHTGLYEIDARFDMQSGAGASIGLRSFVGKVEAERPILVRLRRGHVAGGRAHPELRPWSETPAQN